MPEETYDMSLFTSEFVLDEFPESAEGVIIKSGTITKITEEMFGGNKKIKYLYIEDGVTEIEEYAFAGCSELKVVRLPSTLSRLHCGVFNDCVSLEKIYLPPSVTSIPFDSFYNCESLSVVSLPDTLTFIEHDSFMWCSSLKHLVLPNSLSGIGRGCFRGANIEYLVLPNNIVSFFGVLVDYVYAKPGTVTYDTITFEGTGIEVRDIADAPAEEPVEPENYDMSLFTKEFKTTEMIHVPFASGITVKAGNSSVIPSGLNWENKAGIEYIYIEDGVTKIEPGAFSGFTSLKVVRLPDTLTEIELRAFEDCVSLEYVYLPASLEVVSAFAFFGCESLKAVFIPDSVTYIGSYAFAGCSDLVFADVPETTEIGAYVFSGTQVK